jgi:hypothetical protein
MVSKLPSDLQASFLGLDTEREYIRSLPNQEDPNRAVRVLTESERDQLIQSLDERAKTLQAQGDADQVAQVNRDKERLSSKYIFVDMSS